MQELFVVYTLVPPFYSCLSQGQETNGNKKKIKGSKCEHKTFHRLEIRLEIRWK